MANVQKTIEIPVPVREAYNQWTQVESFPRVMEGVEEGRQLDGPDPQGGGPLEALPRLHRGAGRGGGRVAGGGRPEVRQRAWTTPPPQTARRRRRPDGRLRCCLPPPPPPRALGRLPPAAGP